MTIADRFWAKVAIGPDCWEWTAAKLPHGYGVIRVGAADLGMILAHRVSWQIHFGDIPERLMVLHRCDNPSCVRPDHLFLGDQIDNMQDMLVKGREGEKRRMGKSNGRRKVKEEDVIDIRVLSAIGAESGSLAQAYGISESQIRRICSGQAWAHIPEGLR